ncbi:VOC family protein [Desulfocurvus sp. DL9XJH121]
MSIRFEGPAIFVADMAASRAFYEGLLDQETLFGVGENYTAYKGGLCLWEAGCALGAVHGVDGGGPAAPQGRDNFELYFESEDLDAAWARAQEAGAAAVHGPREMPWTQRCFRIQDPDGHLVEVGEPMPLVIRRLLDSGLSPEATAERTMTPLAMVQAVAQDR